MAPAEEDEPNIPMSLYITTFQVFQCLFFRTSIMSDADRHRIHVNPFDTVDGCEIRHPGMWLIHLYLIRIEFQSSMVVQDFATIHSTIIIVFPSPSI
jgi:hypothetical protein